MPSAIPNESAYVIIALANPHNFPYDDYRVARLNILEACCRIFRLEYSHLTDIVGIATELGINASSRSEDLLYLDTRNWTDEDEEDAKKLQQELGFFNQSRMKFNRQLHHEYPVTEKQRSGVPKEIGRNDPCYCGSGKKYKNCCRRREHGQHRKQ